MLCPASIDFNNFSALQHMFNTTNLPPSSAPHSLSLSFPSLLFFPLLSFFLSFSYFIFFFCCLFLSLVSVSVFGSVFGSVFPHFFFSLFFLVGFLVVLFTKATGNSVSFTIPYQSLTTTLPSNVSLYCH